MKVKTATLTDLALDWAVAQAQGLIATGAVDLYMPRPYSEYSSPLGYNPCRDVYYNNDYRPTRDWSIAGPIIEREKIRLSWERSGVGYWLAHVPGAAADGPTPLIAALRCYVASKLGDEIEIPEELT